ncbi:MAG: acyltransferase [Methylococcales bacterium]|nr:acyltransferase [Methylococcales bacterium]
MTDHSHLNYRPDIDGLRAFAILLVIVFHAYPRLLRGGFIGVDIFFVISGYLITRIILKGVNQGSFSLLDFYSRRIKRIFPALLVVLLFCLFSGWFILLADEYQHLGQHIAAGSVYVSNFILASEAGYFDTSAELKPLLHLWSLSIEEQFYLAFPFLIILSTKFRTPSILTILACLLFSFSLNIYLIKQDQTTAFFYPQMRSWELLIGSAIAYINLYARPQFDQIAHTIFRQKTPNKKINSANILSWFGFLLIVVAWVFFDTKKIVFPGAWALMPAIGTACLILAGNKAWFNQKILSHKIAVFIGLISYPLYLWHWPLLSYLQIIEMEKPSSGLRFLALILSALLAWATYHFVEKKVRYREHWGIPTGLLTGLFLVGATGFQIDKQQGYAARLPNYSNWTAGELGITPWQKNNFISQPSCLKQYGNYIFCLQENKHLAATAVLLGDSHANHFYPGLLNKPATTGGNLFNVGVSSCLPFFDSPDKKCTQLMNKALNLVIEAPAVKTIILSAYIHSFTDKYIFNNHEINPIKKPSTLLKTAMRNTFQQLLNANKRIIFIFDIPKLDFRPLACRKRPWRINGQIAKTPCAIQRAKINEQQQEYRHFISDVLSEFPTITLWDTSPAFCDTQHCWAMKNNKMLYRDNNHLNKTGSLYLSDYFNLQ